MLTSTSENTGYTISAIGEYDYPEKSSPFSLTSHDPSFLRALLEEEEKRLAAMQALHNRIAASPEYEAKKKMLAGYYDNRVHIPLEIKETLEGPLCLFDLDECEKNAVMDEFDDVRILFPGIKLHHVTKKKNGHPVIAFQGIDCWTCDAALNFLREERKLAREKELTELCLKELEKKPETPASAPETIADKGNIGKQILSERSPRQGWVTPDTVPTGGKTR